MKNLNARYLRLGLTLAGTALVIYYWPYIMLGCGLVIRAAMPLILGAIIAYILNAIMNYLEKIYRYLGWDPRYRFPLCMAAAIVVGVLIVALVVFFALPELVEAVVTFFQAVPDWLLKLFHSPALSDLASVSRMEEAVSSNDWSESMRTFITLMSNGAVPLATSVQSLIGNAMMWFVAAIFSIYALSARGQLKSQFRRVIDVYWSKQTVEKFYFGLVLLDKAFSHYIIYRGMEALITGFLTGAAVFLFRIPYALMFGTLIGFCALVPVIGVSIGGAFAFIMLMTESVPQAILFVIVLCLVVQLVQRGICPHLQMRRIALPPVWVVAAVTVGIGLFGIWGMLISVPLAEFLYQLLSWNVKRREYEKAQKPSLT